MLLFASVSGPQELQKYGEPTCLSGDGPLSLPGYRQYPVNRWIPDFETLLQLGSLEMNWSSESDVEGKNIYICLACFPRGHKTGEWGTKSGRLPSILFGIPATQNSSLSASFLDMI